MRALVLVSGLVFATGSVAAADDTFESRAAGAVRVSHLDDIVWALTAPCNAGDDIQQRQCRRLRDGRAAQLTAATLIVDAEREAFVIGAYSPQKKSAPLTLAACIACNGVTVDGQTWYVTGAKEGNPAPAFKGGKLEVGLLHENSRTFVDEGAAKRFAAGAKTAKVQLIVKVPPKATWTDAGKQGIALDVLGYRVYSPCDGSVVCSNPKASAGEVDKKECGAMTSGTTSGTTTSGSATSAASDPDSLSPAMVKRAIKPVIDGAKQCYAKFKVAGKGKLKMAIGADGTLTEYEQQGDFANTPTGACIDLAVKAAAFPTSKKPRTAVAVPISLP
jgi:hypothetical protein